MRHESGERGKGTGEWTIPNTFDAGALGWDKQGGLLPAIVQDAATLRVLMLGYMNREALDATLSCGRVTFFSRSRQCLWMKGEGSGNVLELHSITADCDGDALLVLARPQGPTCHRGTASCFDVVDGSGTTAPENIDAADFLATLDALIAQRHTQRPAGSYTTRLFDEGIRRIAQKVGEEGVETALAAAMQGDAELLGESADLVFHLLVLLRARGLGWRDVVAKLRQRHR
ncbi:MAG: bifunctional phosphoribosyl-AMP cyclohydrolase/phosphoribosyl-ATP diphosphatase HisIE [Proteobacteria bacterium]|nr:bifunctional phosphoribosyl-AMP cyclohydrolase/phosphoribosyl-ATP diphosphatase HisIE [Pseudomonadota bacterium]